MKGHRLATCKIEQLPAGSVEFDHAIAEGVTGIVVGHPMAESRRRRLDQAAASG